MRSWLIGVVGSLAAAGMLYTGVSAQGVPGDEQETDLERQSDDPEVRVERLIRAVGGPDSQIGITVADLEPGDAARGARVSEVRNESPADKAGIRAGDVITAFDGERVRSARQLSRVVGETPAGRAVDVTVTRDGQPVTMQVTPERRRQGFAWRSDGPGPVPPLMYRGPYRMDPRDVPGQEWLERFHRDLDQSFPGSGRGRLGIVAQSLSPQLAEYFGTKHGVLVSSVRDDSPAEGAGLRAGDVITAVDGEQVSSPSDLARLTASADAGEVTISYVRDRKSAEAKVTLPERVRRGTARPI